MRVEHPTFEPDYKDGSGKTFPKPGRKSRICVIGAGAFGGWSALHLLRNEFEVTLVDAWGPGNSRSSSGDETRVTRSTYGRNELYFQMNVRSLEIWKEHEKLFTQKIFHNTGVLWFCYGESTPIVDDSIRFSEKYNCPYEYLDLTEIRKRYPEVNTHDLHHAWFDSYGGYLKAREACAQVVKCFLNEGGTYIQHAAVPEETATRRMNYVILDNGEKVKADLFIFACGSWLPKLFPAELGGVVNPTRQEVYYFGVPNEGAITFDRMPAWIDADGVSMYYGIAGNAQRGFKLGVDIRGQNFDPTSDERLPDPDVLGAARKFLGHRFPRLKTAPLLESRVCPYENSPSGNFILDFLPGRENVIVVGGGSGHGFKHGPALGELVAKALTGQSDVPLLFSLSSQYPSR